MKLKKTLLISLLLAIGATSHASPWIEPTDVFLRQDLQVLADAGLLKTPLNTYPLAWAAVEKDLINVHRAQISDELKFAYDRIQHSLDIAKNNKFRHRVKGGYSSSNPVSFGFTDKPRTNGTWIEASTEYTGKRLAGKINVTGSRDNEELGENAVRFDGSYLSFVYANWALTAGFQDRWWGPGNDTGLILTNNARPIPAISLSRVNSEGFKTPWLSWIGDWTFTTFLGRFEDERVINDALLWGIRANFRPFKNLEIGLSRTIQLGGEGRTASLETFTNAFVGKDNPEGLRGALGQEPGNQLGGADIRYSTKVFGQPIALYGEYTGEDEEGGLPNKGLFLAGAEWFTSSIHRQTKLYLEYTDTEAACFDRQTGNCAYEHDIYVTGYRQFNRSLGSTYDSDSRTVVLGMQQEYDNGHAWNLSLKYLELNRDNLQPFIVRNNNSVPSLGNPLTFGTEGGIDTISVSGSYRWPVQGGILTLGGEYFSERVGVVDDPERVIGYATWEQRF